MNVRDIDGQPATDRRGAAEYLHRSPQTIALLAARRNDTGFPQPVHVDTTGRRARTRSDGTIQGREWYALADLDTFRASYITPVEAAGQARVRGDGHCPGDPDDLLTADQIAELLRIAPSTYRSWIRDSQPDWDAGFPAYLPPPDDVQPRGRGVTRRWKRSTISVFLSTRQGTAPARGRPTGPTATLADLLAILRSDPDLTNRELAARLSHRIGAPVRMQTVIRLQRQRRDQLTGGAP